MSDRVEIVIRKNGSARITGEVVLQDENGNVITPPGNPFSLCRCGHSGRKPFCDGSHKAAPFEDDRPGS